ncbi:hypothetical protein MATL_G00057750 [Megalops atlanticus]|uniref:Uncharacterized protein n=1 Tax=Megalops atlanticus TaxID=7932 RepID=A0A9D3Q8X5_MEGAT|nr:hypothetical protein MATL_G00057750 [Megalops atlanticus]
MTLRTESRRVHGSSTKSSARSFQELPVEFNVLILGEASRTESEGRLFCVLSLNKIGFQRRRRVFPGE